MVAHFYNSSTHDASLGYIGRPWLKTKTKQKKDCDVTSMTLLECLAFTFEISQEYI
jgi:hypothetical protein